MVTIRFPVGAVLALSAAFGVWFAIISAHPIFTAFAPSSLIAPILAGLVGGFIAGLFAPHHKVAFAAFLGVALAGMLLALMVLIHSQAAGRNPLLWYWPAWLAPCFVVGGLLSRKLWDAQSDHHA